MKCPKCGSVAGDQARFCGRCGQAITPQAEAPAIPAAAAPAPAAVLAAEGIGATASSTGGTSSSVPLLERFKNMLLSPRAEWQRIAVEPTSMGEIYLRYAMPLLGIAMLFAFIHMSVIGTSTLFLGTVRAPMILGLTWSAFSFVFGLVGLFLIALLINVLAPTFAAQRDLRQALKVAVYSMTPACLASVFSLVPGLGTLLGLIAAVYGIYLLYLGLVPVMRTPSERAVGYTATIIVVWIVLWILLVVVGMFSGGLGLAHLAGLRSADAQQMAQQEESAKVGNVIGSILGTDSQGKAQLGAAIDNLAKAGAQMDANSSASSSSTGSVSSSSTASSSSPSGNDDAQAAGAAIGGLLGALGGALNGGHRVDPVDFNTLKGMLPDSLSNMQRTHAEGSSNQALGMKGSSAKGTYTGSNDSSVEIEITDVSAVAGLMNVAAAMPQTTESSSDTGYEKDVTVAGYPAHEKYDASSHHAELNFILAKRFTVDLTGEHVDMSALEADASRIDLSRLVSMKDAGAH